LRGSNNASASSSRLAPAQADFQLTPVLRTQWGHIQKRYERLAEDLLALHAESEEWFVGLCHEDGPIEIGSSEEDYEDDDDFDGNS
jgi:hypothetical protein